MVPFMSKIKMFFAVNPLDSDGIDSGCIESTTQKFTEQTGVPTNTISGYVTQEKLYSLNKWPIPY